MTDFSKIDLFFDKLKEMRGIAELDRHLLHLLLTMQPDVSEQTQKFLCLCFSLWDDGNTRVPLDVALFSERWNRKWNGLKKLQESQDESFESEKADFDDFAQIIKTGVDELNSKTFAVIVETLPADVFDERAIHTPLVKRAARIVVDGSETQCPFLYMAKHFKAKLEIQESMNRLFKDGSENAARITKVDLDACIVEISKLAMRFDKDTKTNVPLMLNEEQAQAVLRGQKENLVVTGGPGTGKTTVVLYILWNLLMDLVKDAKELSNTSDNSAVTPEEILCEYGIYLAAPSGKAADRMSESLKNGLKGIKTDLVDADFKKKAVFAKLKNLEGSTIHRLLKYSRNSNGFSFNVENKFPEKSIFVIDEASMIDVNLFASLLQAIPDNARVFVLGDPYQLPSVDAGAVLGEVLKPRSGKNFKVELTISNRFKDKSNIGKLAKKIKECAENEGVQAPNETFKIHPEFNTNEKPARSENSPTDNVENAVKAADGTEQKPSDHVYYYMLPQKRIDENGDVKAAENEKPLTRKDVLENVEKVLKSWAKDFAKLPKMAMQIDPTSLDNPTDADKNLCSDIWTLSLKKRILTAERRGIFGVEQINKTVCESIKESFRELLKKRDDKNADAFKGSRYFPGQLLMITQNQAMYKLYNGDTGIVLFKGATPYIMLKKPNGEKDPEKSRDFVVYPLSLLPADAVESAFAITIHKSQGSEYNDVTMFLPAQEGHPLLNNQILYTGITRAMDSVTIIATPKTFKAACETIIERDTGIEL